MECISYPGLDLVLPARVDARRHPVALCVTTTGTGECFPPLSTFYHHVTNRHLELFLHFEYIS